MQFSSIEDLANEIRQGKMVILVDDETRENEGDLILAADKVTAEHIRFMAREACGLICLSLTQSWCEKLNLAPQVAVNQSNRDTAFTVSIEAASDIATGISAHDRTHTIKTAVNPNAKPEDLVSPGHIFPLRAKNGGVIERAGHTEGSIDLVKIAGLTPAAVIVEIMNEDGTMARRQDLQKFAKKHHLKIGNIADLIRYRITHELQANAIKEATLSTLYGKFKFLLFSDNITNATHGVLQLGTVTKGEAIAVGFHHSQLVEDALSLSDPKRSTLPELMGQIKALGSGLIILSFMDRNLDQISFSDVIRPEYDTANCPYDICQIWSRTGVGVAILKAMNINTISLLNDMSQLPLNAFRDANIMVT